jgi:hypothetical protein
MRLKHCSKSGSVHRSVRPPYASPTTSYVNAMTRRQVGAVNNDLRVLAR